MNTSRPSVIQKLSHLSRPMLTCVLSDDTPLKCFATIRNAIYDGADAFLLDLAKIDKQYKTYADLKKIVDYCEDKPVITINYRSPARPGITDEMLVEDHLLAASAGVSMCDLMGDLFAPTKMELTYDEEAIEAQKRLIAQLHDMGCEVLTSSHTWVPMTVEETIAHAKILQTRGGDMVKIANCALTEQDIYDTMKATFETSRALDVPFLHVCMGQYGKIHRQLASVLGSCMALCVQQYTDASHREQPLLRATKQVFDNIDWHMARDTSFGTVVDLTVL